MGANSPAEGELDHVSGENAVKDVFQEKGKEVEKDVHPLAAFLALHGIDGAEDDDEMESEDEEWQPHVRWICTNCIMPNPEDEVYCWKCNEHRNSSILEQGFMSVSSEPKGMAYMSSDVWLLRMYFPATHFRETCSSVTYTK